MGQPGGDRLDQPVPLPVVATVNNGAASYAGLAWILASDPVVARARLILGFVVVGLVPAVGTTPVLVQLWRAYHEPARC